jgi:hypothetical protein
MAARSAALGFGWGEKLYFNANALQIQLSDLRNTQRDNG